MSDEANWTAAEYLDRAIMAFMGCASERDFLAEIDLPDSMTRHTANHAMMTAHCLVGQIMCEAGEGLPLVPDKDATRAQQRQYAEFAASNAAAILSKLDDVPDNKLGLLVDAVACSADAAANAVLVFEKMDEWEP